VAPSSLRAVLEVYAAILAAAPKDIFHFWVRNSDMATNTPLAPHHRGVGQASRPMAVDVVLDVLLAGFPLVE
jgi:hypothetical protein